MSHLFDQKISELESVGLCKELSNDESEMVAGGMFVPFIYPSFVPMMGIFSVPSSASTTKPDENTTTTVEKGDGWMSYTSQTHVHEVKYETSP
ncbi:hypothetical protein ACF3DV_18430 [Chlorogloeopsis fritschii PCC 9212]|uniref:Uncharacterized protein n=1 Tax=Chlorogloeopsis fritschii PCC 6912 TaxID=211165 RepID=A0A433NHR1_CHLFR|nr:hypothetical protein [Chlorogloeopsis fritschii]RUR81849.1 hypothetical protein PCC6912_27180 [Chlorogloeopsis fritschii PCC 6912]